MTDITVEVLEGTWNQYNENTFYKSPQKCARIEAIQKWLQALYNHHQLYLDQYHRGVTTYEDLYAICIRLQSELIGERFDVTARALLDKFWPVLTEAARKWRPQLGGNFGSIPIPAFLNACTLYIQYAVRSRLHTKNKPIGLDLISECCNSEFFSHVEIFTLNHDDLIERHLTSSGIHFEDGFAGDYTREFREQDPEKLDTNTKVKLYKLHGSIDWFYVNKRENNGSHSEINIFCSAKIDLKNKNFSSSGFHYSLADCKPFFLTGTDTKLIQYHFGLVHEVFHRFQKNLKSCNRLIVSGYGWNDLGVNPHLEQWPRDLGDRKMIILHRKPQDLKQSKSPIFYDENLTKLKNNRRLFLYEKWLSETTLKEILDFENV